MRPLSELGRRENGGRECIRAAVALLGPLVLARARHPLPRPPSSPRVSPARLLATLFLSLCLCVSLATAAVDVFEAIEISTYPSSATKCEEFSIRVPGLNPPRDRPLTVQTIHILLLYPSPLSSPFVSFLTPDRCSHLDQLFQPRRTLQRTWETER